MGRGPPGKSNVRFCGGICFGCCVRNEAARGEEVGRENPRRIVKANWNRRSCAAGRWEFRLGACVVLPANRKARGRSASRPAPRGRGGPARRVAEQGAAVATRLLGQLRTRRKWWGKRLMKLDCHSPGASSSAAAEAAAAPALQRVGRPLALPPGARRGEPRQPAGETLQPGHKQALAPARGWGGYKFAIWKVTRLQGLTRVTSHAEM